MNFKLASSPHQHIRRTTGQIMSMVIFALIPGILLQTWFFGWGTLIQVLLAITTAVITEASILELRKRDFERAIKDNSAILAAILLAISIPPFAPWWVIVIGTFFAIAIVKQLYGGLGFNLFNPAMAAYVMLLVSFPVQMTQWLPPLSLAAHQHTLMDAIQTIFTGFNADGFSLIQLQGAIDGHTMATPLDAVKTGLAQGMTYEEGLNTAQFSGSLGIGWMWINIAYILGGLY
jgi:electron transport complex protein RnfD